MVALPIVENLDLFKNVRLGFLAIDVRDAMLNGDLLSGNLCLPLLEASFVGHIPRDLNDLIAQFNLPI